MSPKGQAAIEFIQRRVQIEKLKAVRSLRVASDRICAELGIPTARDARNQRLRQTMRKLNDVMRNLGLVR